MTVRWVLAAAIVAVLAGLTAWLTHASVGIAVGAVVVVTLVGIWLLREFAADVDRAVTEVEAAARAEEQERHQRILHDRVLQIMEMLARGDRPFDTGVRGQVAAEAAWLRDLVETGRERPPDNLVAELESLVVTSGRQGLRVALNTAGLAGAGNPHDRLPPAHVSALVEAVREALTNVRKHSGTDIATVRATCGAHGLTLTVVDAGRGFEGEPERGSGLRRSIIGRLAEIGGSVLIESAEGEGTSIELRLPMP